MDPFKNIKNLSHYATGSFSLFVKLTINSIFFRFNKIESLLSLYYSSFILKRYYKFSLNVKFLKIIFRFSHLYSTFFYIRYPIDSLLFFLINNLHKNDNALLKAFKFHFNTGLYFIHDFFLSEIRKIYFSIYKIRMFNGKSLFLNTNIFNFLLRIRKFDNKFDVTEILNLKFFSGINVNYFLKIFLRKFTISVSSSCTIIKLMRKLVIMWREIEFLKLINLKNFFKRKANIKLILKKTLHETILIFFKTILKKHNIFYFEIFKKNIQCRTKNIFRNFLRYTGINYLIFNKLNEFIIWQVGRGNCIKKINYFFNLFMVRKINCVQISSKISFAILNFLKIKFLYYLIVLPQNRILLNKLSSKGSLRYFRYFKFCSEKMLGLSIGNYKKKPDKKKNYAMLFKLSSESMERVDATFIKNGALTNFFTYFFFKFSTIRLYPNSLEYLEIITHFISLLFNFVNTEKGFISHRNTTNTCFQKKIGYFLNKIYLKFLFSFIFFFFDNSLKRLNWCNSYFIKKCFNLFRIYISGGQLTLYFKVLSKFVYFFKIKKINELNHLGDNEVFNEYFEKINSPYKVTRVLSKFLKNDNLFFLLKNKLSFFIRLKDFLVGILWEKNSRFNVQIIGFSNYQIKIHSSSKFLFRSLIMKYIRNWNSFGYILDLKRNLRDIIEIKNLTVLTGKCSSTPILYILPIIQKKKFDFKINFFFKHRKFIFYVV